VAVDLNSVSVPTPGGSADPTRLGIRTRRSSPVRTMVGLVRAARPKQWLKNVLVLGAPAAAGVITHPTILGRSLVAVIVFCLAAGGTYLLNDTIDAEADRLHPTKCRRPIAAGTVSVQVGLAAAFVAMTLAVALAALITLTLAGVMVAYITLTISYSLWLKREAVLDIGAIAGGFVLRAVAGGVATGVPLSQWFLIVASFGSLFMVVGKRQGEYSRLGDDRGRHRRALTAYSIEYLRYMRSVASSATVVAYCLWAFDRAKSAGPCQFWFEASIAPFVLGIFRYGILIEAGQAEAPEEAVLGDRPLQILGLIWACAFGLGVYKIH